MLLGVQKDSDYKRFELDIEPNDIIFLLTDGVTECKFQVALLNKKKFLMYFIIMYMNPRKNW